MSEYRDFMRNLCLDGNFKQSIAEKMRAVQSSVGADGEPAPAKRRKRAVFAPLAAAACAVLACLVVIPLSLMYGKQPQDSSGMDNIDGSAPERLTVPLGQRAEDVYGNYMQFTSVDYSYEINIGGTFHAPAEGNVFVLLGVELDLTHEAGSGELIELSSDSVEAEYLIDTAEGDVAGTLVFREDFLDLVFDSDESGVSGRGMLVFETGEEFAEILDAADPAAGSEGYIIFSCAFRALSEKAGSMVETLFMLPLDLPEGEAAD